MESTLPLPFLVSVTLPPGLGGAGEGLTREDVLCLGTVFFEVTPATLEEMLGFLAQHAVNLHPYLNVSGLASRNDIVSLLDAGARMVFVQPERLPDLAEFDSRVAPLVVGNQGLGQLASPTKHGLLVSGFDVTQGDISQVVEEARARKISPLFLKPVQDAPDLDRLVGLARQCNAIPVLPSTGLTTNKEEAAAGKLHVAKILSCFWATDRPDGLVPTVVCDENGFALGLVYSSAQSVGEALRTRTGVYHSRKRGLWYKGATSGDTQELVRISLDCDSDSLKFVVKQRNRFCHLPQSGCFGEMRGIPRLEQTLLSRKESAPPGSYTARLFSDEKLLRAKIMEEAEELCDAKTPECVAFEAADLIYFALARAVSAGVSLADIERSLDAKSLKVKRRTGDAKGKWAEKEGIAPAKTDSTSGPPAPVPTASDKIVMPRLDPSSMTAGELESALKRPSQRSSEDIMNIVKPIINDVRQNGDRAVLAYTHKFEKATSLTSPVLKAPFPEALMQLPPETVRAIDLSFENIRKFHAAQAERPLQVETMPGVVCSRFSRPIEAVGLYVPGGTAVLPSTALMLGVPAMVAGCRRIVLASPPRADGTVTPEIVYVAHRVGAEAILLAGGAQAVAAMAYGTESVPKVDKIYGPGNQFVTAAKMHVANDANAAVAIDMPAGPSEVLVVADAHANAAFVASDLLSQAEHGVDSQVVLLAVGMGDAELAAVEAELDSQARALPRVDIVRQSIAHSATVRVRDTDEAMRISNAYAPEHLILQVRDAERLVPQVANAGSVFIGPWTPESVGDYSAGVNHSLPTYGYAKQYSGVNLGSFLKHITSSNLTAEGLRNVGEAVMQLAKVEELEAHRRAISIRLEHMAAHGENMG